LIKGEMSEVSIMKLVVGGTGEWVS